MDVVAQMLGMRDEEVAENEEVTHESGLSRLCKSMLLAVCVAPLLMLAMVFLLGWNEKRAVCEAKAFDEGQKVVKEIGCTSTAEGAGALVMFSCDIQKDSLPTFGAAGTDFDVSYQGTGLKVVSMMYQCIEKAVSTTKKDSTGGGGKTTVTTYTYRMDWSKDPVDSGRFRKKDSMSFRRQCGMENPSWPATVPKTSTQYAEKMKVGVFTTDKASHVPLDTPITDIATPVDWMKSHNTFISTKWRVPRTATGDVVLGDVKVNFYGNDWNNKKVTVLGKNSNGNIESWTASGSWLCSGSTVSNFRMGTVTKDELFKAMKSDSNAVTWVLRIVGFLLLWLAWSLLGGPLGIFADCIPCIGPMLGDMVEWVVCIVTCLPACACCMFVVAVVWVAMRPLVGVPLFVMSCSIAIGFAIYKYNAAQKKQNTGEPSGQDGVSQEVVTEMSDQGSVVYTGPVPSEVAVAFVSVLREEYVEGQEGAVGPFLDNLPPEEQNVLLPIEDSVREAYDKDAAIRDIKRRWNMKASE